MFVCLGVWERGTNKATISYWMSVSIFSGFHQSDFMTNRHWTSREEANNWMNGTQKRQNSNVPVFLWSQTLHCKASNLLNSKKADQTFQLLCIQLHFLAKKKTKQLDPENSRNLNLCQISLVWKFFCSVVWVSLQTVLLLHHVELCWSWPQHARQGFDSQKILLNPTRKNISKTSTHKGFFIFSRCSIWI